MPDNDETLELRRRARRRLVGAVALVLALVIVPPWVMDLEPKPVATNLTVEIPRPETGVLKPTPVVPPAKAAAPSKAAAAAPTPPAAPAIGADKSGAIPRPPDVSPSTGKAGDRPKPEPAKAPPKPEAVARVAPPEPARTDPDAKRAEAILNSEAAFLVPLGAFANKDNVQALEAKLAKAGVKYYTEVVTTPGGEQTRVRAGPFPTKEAAEKSRDQLKSLGLSPGAVIARQ